MRSVKAFSSRGKVGAHGWFGLSNFYEPSLDLAIKKRPINRFVEISRMHFIFSIRRR